MFNLEVLQAEAKRDLTNNILEEMDNYLDNSQLMELNRSVNKHLDNLSVYHHNNVVADYDERNRILVEDFVKTKRLKGLSENSIYAYTKELNRFCDYSCKLVLDYSPEDIRDYLSFRHELNNCSNVSLNNIRRNLSSFYSFLFDEEYILKNPMKAVKNIKEPKRIKKPFTGDEIEIMRKSLQSDWEFRDLAIFELLLSSGIRLSECVSLDIKDLDFNEQSFNVVGKGNKERKCYFGTKAKFALQDYLNSRDDDNPALFVGLVKINGEYRRINTNVVVKLFSSLGEYCGIDKVHAHRLRRTFSSKLLHRKVPIEQIQKLLGHDNINTTLLYVDVAEEDVKLNYYKYKK